MPFLALRLKKSGGKFPEIQDKHLEKLLCPYQGGVERVDVPGGRIYLTGAGENKGGKFRFPQGGREAPNTAWARIRVLSSGFEFETDPLSQFPLWTYEDAEVQIWTPEVKALSAVAGVAVQWKRDAELLAVERRDPFYTPYLNVRRTEKISPFEKLTSAAPFTDPELAHQGLKSALLSSAAEFPLEGEPGVYLSGGIDSSVAAALFQRRHTALHAYTLGSSLGNEFGEARELALELGMEHRTVLMGDSESAALFDRVVFANECFDGLTAEILLQTLRCAQLAAESGCQDVATGYGSDLLFGGMLRHQAYLEAVGVRDTLGLLERTSWSMELSPLFSWAQGVRMHHLYWDPRVISQAVRIPMVWNFSGTSEKTLLRELAIREGWLKRPHAYRPKLGMTNGTRVHELLSRALSLDASYAYAAKSAHALALCKRVIAGETFA